MLLIWATSPHTSGVVFLVCIELVVTTLQCISWFISKAQIPTSVLHQICFPIPERRNLLTQYLKFTKLCRLTSRRSQPPLALAVPLSRFTPRVGGGSAFYVRLFSLLPAVRNLPAMEFSSMLASLRHDAPPCCCVLMPPARTVPGSRRSWRVPPMRSGNCATSRQKCEAGGNARRIPWRGRQRARAIDTETTRLRSAGL